METLLNKIESYGFECEAGPLKNCLDWMKLREALAQPAADDKAGGEAIAKLRRTEFGSGNNRKSATHIDTLVPLDVLNALPDGTLLFARPQPQDERPAERVALTDEQFEALAHEVYKAERFTKDDEVWHNFHWLRRFSRAIEAAHGITAKDQS